MGRSDSGKEGEIAAGETGRHVCPLADLNSEKKRRELRRSRVCLGKLQVASLLLGKPLRRAKRIKINILIDWLNY